MEVLKTESIKEEVTDRDVVTTVNVSSDIEYMEHVTFRSDIISSNEVPKTIKYETNITEEKITTYDTDMGIQAEHNDIKYELDIEVTDKDELSVFNVSSNIDYKEQMTIRSDISSNEVGVETIKYETNIAEETIPPYDTQMGIKTEINYFKSELDIEEYKLNYKHLKSTSTEDYKERGNVHLEHIGTKCNALKIHVASKYGDNDELYQPNEHKYKRKARKDVEHCKVQGNEITKWYQCDYCDFKTKFKANFSRHHSLKHNGPAEVFFCASCDFKTKSKHYLLPHIKLKHVNSEIFHCELCDYKTECKRNLLRHHKRIHDDSAEIFHCKICDFKTKDKHHMLRRHGLKHDESAEIVNCELCDFKTKCKLYLLRHHRRVHSAEIFHCELCHFKTKCNVYLLKHHRRMHDSSLESRHLSPYKTKYSKRLAEHLAKIHGKSVQCFQCSICACSFAKREYLVMHLKKKHSENPLECYSCGFRTKYKHSLLGHIRRKHKN